MSRLLPSPSYSGPSNDSSSLGLPSTVASLRTRRPSAKPVASEPSKLRKGSNSDGKPKDRMSRVVSDKIKRRLSMRYAEDTNLLELPPAVPSIPSAYTSSQQSHYQRQNSHPGPSAGAVAARRRPTVDASGSGQQGGATMWGEETGQGGQYDSGLDLESIGMAGIGVRKGSQAVGEDEGIGGGRRRGGITLDLSLLGKEGFDAEAYIKSKLAGASSEEIQNFARALEASKAATSTDLQRNVFKNYAEFVVISKEITTLENDMLELKDLLGEWKGVPEALVGLEIDDPALGARKSSSTTMTPSPSNRRSSILDLQNLYRNQLMALHHSVSGAQKYVPLVPGRHIVAEAAAFVELNPATYKLKGPVRLFVLNDLVLVAVIKKRMGNGEGGREREASSNGRAGGGNEESSSSRNGRLVADRCWILTEVTVIDVKDSGDLTNAIKIRRGKETAIFRTERNEDKKSLLAAFRQVAESLAEQKRKNLEKEQVRRRSMWQSDMDVSVSSTSGIPPIPGSSSIGQSPSRHNLPGSRSSISDLSALLNGSQSGPGLDSQRKDLRWIDDFGDELAVAIALRNWDEAVRLALKAREQLSPVQSSAFSSHSSQQTTQPYIHLLRTKLQPLSDALLSSLTHELSSPTLRKPTLVQLVALFYSLDQQHLASSTFLAARTDVLKKRVRTIKFEGDIGGYVNELAIVTFMGVKNTSDWFQAGFKENIMLSGLVEWAKEQIETFSKMFRRQVFGPDVDPTVVQESLEAVRVQSKKFLTYEGLDLSFLLRSLLADNPNSQAIDRLYDASLNDSSPGPSPLPSALPTTLPCSSTSSAFYQGSPTPLSATPMAASSSTSPRHTPSNLGPSLPPTAPLSTRPSRPRAPSSANNSSTSIPRYTSSPKPRPNLPLSRASSPSLPPSTYTQSPPASSAAPSRNYLLESLGRPVGSMERTQSSTSSSSSSTGREPSSARRNEGEPAPPPRPPRRERKPGPPGAI